MKSCGKTNVGLYRTINEDSIFCTDNSVGPFPNLYIVADGMGGHNGGEVASSKAVEFFIEYGRSMPENNCEYMDLLVGGVQHANKRVYELSKTDPSLSGMGTTFSACVFDGDKAIIAHIGDSRIYSFCGGTAHCLTTDHTYVNEMVRAGMLTQEEAGRHPKRNVLTRVLGFDEKVDVDTSIYNCTENEKICLCTDGLTNMLSEDEILTIVNSAEDLENKTDMLIEAAIKNGGHDNISVILTER